MPNRSVTGVFRSGVTSAVLLLSVPCGMTNASQIAAPRHQEPRRDDWTNGEASISHSIPVRQLGVERAKKIVVATGPGLSEFGRKLLALREAAIAEGMQLRSLDEINHDLRAAREA